MRLFSGRRGRADVSASSRKAEREASEQLLEQWIAARHGVEIFVEPSTAVTGTTMLLVAHDGEFTRRKVADPAAAQVFARAHTLPIYDATVVGYPQRMRDYSRRETLMRKRALQREVDPGR